MISPTDVSYDSLLSWLGTLVNDPTFDPIDNDLLITGNLRMISNEKLKTNLSEWTSDIKALQEMERGWQKAVEERINPYFEEIGIQRDIVQLLFSKKEILDLWLLDKSLQIAPGITASSTQVDTKQLLQDKKLEGMIASAIAYNQLANYQSFALKNKMEETIALLKNEIK